MMIPRRRIAQRQSASTYTEEVAAFDSCSAYQLSSQCSASGAREILFLSHCVPNPPDKGERIRAHYELRYLAERYRVHLVCFARSEQEWRDAELLRDCCASVYAERIDPQLRLGAAIARFAFGACLNAAYYGSSRMRRYTAELLQTRPIAAAMVFSAVMSQYVPGSVPMLLDMIDVDSAKWFGYAERRWPGFAFHAEARRMRRFERLTADRAACTFLTTAPEAALLAGFAPRARISYLENGVDFDYFDGRPRPLPAEFAGAPFVVFAGSMDYHPNIEAACSFAAGPFRKLREACPELRFIVVGRNPSREVRQLARMVNGVVVTGGVADVRPFLAAAAAVVAPLRLARGIQNKVLEALAMGRQVFVSDAVYRTFGTSAPEGVVCCADEQEWLAGLTPTCRTLAEPRAGIRGAARRRFDWAKNLDALGTELEKITACAAESRCSGAGQG